MNVQLKDVTPIIKAILGERDKIPRIIDKERYIPNPQPYHDGDCMRGGIRKALRIIEQAPVVDAIPRWISVEEQEEPMSDGEYLCYGYWFTSKRKWIGVAEYLGEWKIVNNFELTHWMPLPEPPKEEKE